MCWECHRAKECSCEWSACLRPVNGWNSIKEKTDTNKTTYLIFDCPKFIPTKSPKRKECLKCGNLFLSFADNVFCSPGCYLTYTPKIEKVCIACKEKFLSSSSKEKYCKKCLNVKKAIVKG